MHKKIIFILVFIIFSGTSVFAKDFSDLEKNHWAYGVINKLADEGVISGYTDGTFKPSNNITRAEFSSLLVLSSNLTSSEVKSFEDVLESHWAYNYVGIVGNYWPSYNANNYSEFFPENKCTREEVAATIVSANKLENTEYNIENIDRFSDSNLISEDLRKYVAIAYENELMVGNADGTFNPKGELTRAEVAQIIFNIRKMEKNQDNTKSNNIHSSDEKEAEYNENLGYEKYEETIVKVLYKNGELSIKDVAGNECLYIFSKPLVKDTRIEIGQLTNHQTIKSVFIEKVLSECDEDYEIKVLELNPLSFEVIDVTATRNYIGNISFLLKIIF